MMHPIDICVSILKHLSLLVVLCSVSFGLISASGFAQDGHPSANQPTEQILTSYEGQNVSSIEVAGHPDLDSSRFKPLLAQKAGEPFAAEKVNQSADAIKLTGKYTEVRIRVLPEADGVRVLLIPEPAMYFGIFQFPGAERFPYSRLVQVANYPTGTPFNAIDVEQDRQALLTFIRQAGYFEADVQTEVQTDSQHGIADVLFHTTLGRKAKFGTVNTSGVSPADQADMQHRLQTIVVRARGAAIRPGKNYNRSTLTRASNYLQSKLQKEGYLGAQVKLAAAEYHADTNSADIHFAVNPGAKTRVQIAGAHLWPWTKKSLLPVYQGVGVDDETVQEGQQALISYFQGKGFFNVKVDSQLTGGEKDRTVEYRVSKEKKHKLTEVSVSGNKQIKSSDLTSHVDVQKKRFFSHGNFSDQLVRSSVKNLKAVYQSQGFSNVQIDPTVNRKGGDVQVTFYVTEGPRDIVNSLNIEGANTFPESRFAPNGLKVAAGQPYSQVNVLSDRANIVANYLKAGYLTSTFRETATAVSKSDPHHINVVYHIYEGPRVFTGEILTLGRVQTQQRLIDRDVSMIKPDQPLTLTDLLTAGSKLYDHTGVFDWAQVDPKRLVTTQTTEDVLIKVHEAKRNEFIYGFGFEVINRGGSVPGGTVAVPGLPPVGLPPNFTTSQQTFYGPRGSAQYTRNNLRGRGESLSFTGFAGRLDQRVAAYYIDPAFRWSPWRSTTSFTFESNQENPLYSSVEETAGFQVQRYVDAARKNLVFLQYSFNKTDLTRIEIPDLVPPQDQHVRLSTLAANFTRDTRDNVLDEHRGVLDSVEVAFNSSKLGSNVDFAKLTAQAAFYKEKYHHIVWANSIRIGLAQPFNNSFVPLSEAFFTGGSNSLRGFPLDSAGPQRQVKVCSSGSSSDCSFIQVPSGGNELLLINSEARIPMPFKKGLSIVPFYDGGNVFPLVGFQDFTKLYSNNVGLGLRYSTPVGPIRVDFGHNLNPVPGIKPTQYFITVGQAF
jgi:outer membrane protein assembly factor BamA